MEVEEPRDQTVVQQFVCFKLAHEEYALNISYIQEVIRVPKITPVPQMPKFCLGVINIRGNVNPVFDLRRMFSLPEKPFDATTKLVIATIDSITMSLVVDEILENIKLDAAHIDPTPSAKMRINKEAVFGIGEIEGRMIVIIDLPKIHDIVRKSIRQEHMQESSSEKGG